MANFVDLPVELLPHIISHIVKPHHLNLICLVNKLFYYTAIIQLYKRVSIYPWQRDGKTKIKQLFATLASCPHLAAHVRRLVIRDFPKASSGHASDFLGLILKGLRSCTGLKSCTWTRDGSISPDILTTLSALPMLLELEINGRSLGNYNPIILRRFTMLSKLSLIMPDVLVVGQLHPWFLDLGRTLESLTITCKTSPAITDHLLESLASSLTNLRHLHLTGCSRVTHRGVWSILCRNAVGGLEGLGLQGVSTRFDISELTRLCVIHDTLSNLLSITLTIQWENARIWMSEIPTLLSASSRLQDVHFYSTEALHLSPTLHLPSVPSPSSTLVPRSGEFWSRVVSQHGQTLRRFSVHRVPLSLDTVKEVCVKCPSLKELFVSIQSRDTSSIKLSLSQSPLTLRSVHINTPHLGERYFSPDEALEIVNGCSAPLTQFGCNERVWQVSRRIEPDSNGELRVHRELQPYESPDIPEAFLVVRT